MKDLGRTEKQLYDSPASPIGQKTNKKIYPDIRLPLNILDGKNFKKGDKISFNSNGVVAGIEDTKWSQNVIIEAQEGELKKIGKQGKGDSLLAEA